MLSARNVENGRIVFDDFRLLAHDDFEREHARTRVAPGDVLVTIVGALGRAAVVPDVEPFTLQRSVAVLKPRGIDPAFLCAQFQAPTVQAWIQANAKGTAQRGIYLGALGELSIVVPPIREQRRIVTKLEALRDRSRRARDALDAVPPLLEKLRQSILAAAFRGDLTKDWRAKHENVEPASKLLERIRAERRKTWEQNEIVRMNAKGKTPNVEAWKERYKQPPSIDAAGLPQLPNGWCWASVAELCELQLGQQRAPVHTRAETTHPYLRAANIKWDGLDLSDVKRMGFPDVERYLLQPGDVLLSEASGSATEVGKPAIWRGEIANCCYQKTLLRARPVSASVSSEWLHLSFLADALLGRFARMAPGVGILHLTADRMLSWPLAVAPRAEQAALIAIAQKALASVSQQEASVALMRDELDRLERSVLGKAFRGDLVTPGPIGNAKEEVANHRSQNASSTVAPRSSEVD